MQFGIKQLAKNSAYVLGGTVGAQLINVAVTPIITRYYTPDSFGILAIFISIISIAIVPSTLKYEFAIPTAKTEEDAGALVYISVSLLVIAAALLAMFVIVTPQTLRDLVGIEADLMTLLLFPIGLFFFGIYQILTYLYSYKERFKHIALSKFTTTGIMSIIQVMSGIFYKDVLFLIVGYIGGRIGGIFVLWERKVHLRAFSLKALKATAKRYDRFPKYVTLASLINMIGTQATPIILKTLYTIESVGLFSLSMRIMILPVQLMGQSVGQVLYSSLSKSTENSGQTLIEIVRVLFTVCAPFFIVIFLYGDIVFAFVFGENWSDSGIFAKWLCPWLMISVISNPLSLIAYVKNRQKTALKITVFETALRLIAIYGGSYFGGIEWSIKLFSIAGAIISVNYIIWICRISNVSIFKLLYNLRWVVLRYAIIIILGISVSLAYPTVIIVAIVFAFDLYHTYKRIKVT
ncbi:MAG: oligosaccharide flippase family protein [Cyclobacteriaceae bacterium]